METDTHSNKPAPIKENTNSKAPEISIIVPVYNMEKYLRKCLSSIMNQTYSDWECIVVDDGSSDNTPAICDEYVAMDTRFKVIHRKNGGLSAARNTGLRAAQGTYIGFVDSDDWIEPDLYQHMHQLATEHSADMVQVGYYKEFYGYSHHKHRVSSLRVLNRKEAATEMIMAHSIPSYVWNKLFKRSAINSEFPEGKNFEDVYALNRWMANINRVVLSPKMLCHYRCRRGSIVRAKSAEDRAYFYENYFIERIHMLEKLETCCINKEQRHKVLWHGYMGKAKSIARIQKLPLEERRKALHTIIDEATRDAGEPDPKILGKKMYKNILTLLKDKSHFIRQALFTQRINHISARIFPF